MIKVSNMFKRDDRASIGGTSYHGVDVYASLETMEKLFGPAGGCGDKTKHEWVFRGAKFNVAVYDYRYDGEREGYWHVGARNETEAEEFARWFNTRLQCKV